MIYIRVYSRDQILRVGSASKFLNFNLSRVQTHYISDWFFRIDDNFYYTELHFYFLTLLFLWYKHIRVKIMGLWTVILTNTESESESESKDFVTQVLF